MHVRAYIFRKDRTTFFKMEILAIPLRHIIVFFANNIVVAQFRRKGSKVHTYAFATHDTPHLILVIHQHPRQRMDDPVLAIQITMRHIQGYHVLYFFRHINILCIITVTSVIEHRFLHVLIPPFESLYRDDRIFHHRNQVLLQPKRPVTVVLTQPLLIHPRLRHRIIPCVDNLIGRQHLGQQMVSYKASKTTPLVMVWQILAFRIITPCIFPHVIQRTDAIQRQYGIGLQKCRIAEQFRLGIRCTARIRLVCRNVRILHV